MSFAPWIVKGGTVSRLVRLGPGTRGPSFESAVVDTAQATGLVPNRSLGYYRCGTASGSHRTSQSCITPIARGLLKLGRSVGNGQSDVSSQPRTPAAGRAGHAAASTEMPAAMARWGGWLAASTVMGAAGSTVPIVRRR